ncbi:hypothetical protein EV14_1283 [Prochlorococcus sp. MIT 0703]|nr:hypothetical protein EV12_0022 [Prochlorococcus sp. MIT 0701]KGG34387.1 hypothetical protein EV14_1283 [Prochlorococcus sp. MIT 0703]
MPSSFRTSQTGSYDKHSREGTQEFRSFGIWPELEPRQWPLGMAIGDF